MSYGDAFRHYLGRPGTEVGLHIKDSTTGEQRMIRVKRARSSAARSARVAFDPVNGQSLAIADMMIGTTRWSPTGSVPSRRFETPGVAVS